MRIVIPNVDPTKPPVVDGEYSSLREAVEINRYALRGADLQGADLRDADLLGADLRDANLQGADLQGADLEDAILQDADLRDAENLPPAPVVEKLHTKILAAVVRGEFDMRTWHHTNCKTTHCRAGWAIHLAGKAGYALEKQLGPNVAGALITLASCPELQGRVPDWTATNSEAIAEIRRLAALEAERS